jgi:hypothetical protein
MRGPFSQTLKAKFSSRAKSSSNPAPKQQPDSKNGYRLNLHCVLSSGAFRVNIRSKRRTEPKSIPSKFVSPSQEEGLRYTGRPQLPTLPHTTQPLVQQAPPGEVLLTSNDDDPFTRPRKTEHRTKKDFTLDAQGKPVGLVGPHVRVDEDHSSIYEIKQVGENEEQMGFVHYATNPWSPAKPDAQGNFNFTHEPRFPFHNVELDPSGEPRTDEKGRRVWTPRDEHAAQSTAFDSLNAVYHSVSDWAGRPVEWGEKGQLPVYVHSFLGFNAFYDPMSRSLMFGVMPYRVDGDDRARMFELASSWEIAAHEGGHALHNELKPNRKLLDSGFSQWSESFGDQLATYASLQHPERVKALLEETGGDLSQSNAASMIGEAYGKFSGTGRPTRDAVNRSTVGNSGEESHDASETLTGAAYSVFLALYDWARKQKVPAEQAIPQAAEIMGTLLVRASDFSPEDSMSLEDVAKAYLTVDKEFYGGKLQKILVSEFERRQLFTRGSFTQWQQRQQALPKLTLPPKAARPEVEAFLQKNLAALNLPPSFGVRLQDDATDSTGRRIVRTELTWGRGPDAVVIANHGSLIFRADGTLAEAFPTFPEGLSEREAVSLLERSKKMPWRNRGQWEFAKDKDGQWQVQVAVAVSDADGVGGHFEVYDLNHPEGQRVDFKDLFLDEKWDE